ncbi:hypothetical protein [Holdemania sp. 1001095H_141210_F2]|jgi:hypothetical protein|uniref:hypothetical protein n=1 Tax=Holdemania sp. 1001095H_141210_F2 TaxID=2787149 RepID=UPI00189CF822|nr:hypothetical protein [Holdemania sp. 1001095H_141210_F2]
MAALGEEFKSSGITERTPKNIMLGAGTIHKGLTFETNKWNFEESLIGATSGGTKVTIKPELMDVEVDGALVKVKGLVQKVGETATMETNMVEVTPETLKMTLIGQESESSDKTGYSEITSKARIEEGDYIKNLAYVGKTLEGKPIIIVFDNALCTSGFEIEGKNKENVVLKATFECYAELTPECDTLPYHIYYPTPSRLLETKA